MKTPPKIYDMDALDRMAVIEGPVWKHKQINDRKNPFGFFAYLDAWKALIENNEVGEMSPYEAMVIFLDLRGDGAIYGEGGYNRYHVDKEGTIKFDYGLARKEKQELARQEGFPPG